jgi:hypothetical protein
MYCKNKLAENSQMSKVLIRDLITSSKILPLSSAEKVSIIGGLDCTAVVVCKDGQCTVTKLDCY